MSKHMNVKGSNGCFIRPPCAGAALQLPACFGVECGQKARLDPDACIRRQARMDAQRYSMDAGVSGYEGVLSAASEAD